MSIYTVFHDACLIDLRKNDERVSHVLEPSFLKRFLPGHIAEELFNFRGALNEVVFPKAVILHQIYKE